MKDPALIDEAATDPSKLDPASRERLVRALARFVLQEIEEDRRKQRQRKVGD